MKYGSLFTGIGGIDLGLDRAGMECAWQVEIDPHSNKVLERHWPDVKRYTDIHEVTNLEPVDLICGGFPCQPVSLAGKREAQADSRWLWPEFSRVVNQVGPRYILIENVPGLLYDGALATVLSNLAEAGYDAEWFTIPASAFGAPHKRDRIFVVAQTIVERRGGRSDEDAHGQSGALQTEGPSTGNQQELLADTDRKGKSQSGIIRQEQRRRTSNGSQALANTDMPGPSDGRPTSPPPSQSGEIRDISQSEFERRSRSWWTVEPDVGRVVDGVPGRVDRLKGLGNAVVPQIAEWIGLQILEHDYEANP